MITGLRGRAVCAGVVALVWLVSPALAGAHLRSGTVAVDYRASVQPANTSAYSAQIFQSDRALSLTVKPGHIVVLLGYLGEPVFRLDPAGLSVNAASPTAVVVQLIKKPDRVVSSTPRWRLEPGRRSVVWQDTRAQGLPPGVGERTWSAPLIVDGRRGRLEGKLQRFPAPSPWPWLGMLGVVLAAGLSSRLLGRRDLGAPAANAFAGASAGAAVVILVAFAADAYASPGTWIEGADAIAFIGVGAWALLCGPQHWHVAAAIGLGLVGLAVGLLEGAIFVHPIVLAILPAALIRFIDVVAIGAGLAAALLGGLFYVETAGPHSDDSRTAGPETARVPTER